MPFGSAGDPNHLVLVAPPAHPEPKIVVSVVRSSIGIQSLAILVVDDDRRSGSVPEIVVDVAGRVGDCEVFAGDGIAYPELLLFRRKAVQQQDEAVDGGAYDGDGVGEAHLDDANVEIPPYFADFVGTD